MILRVYLFFVVFILGSSLAGCLESGGGGDSAGSAGSPVAPTVVCSNEAVTGSLAAITPAISPSRLTGVAPLSVFFDATSTTATATSKPFHELEFRWGFGDAGSGVWGAGSRASSSSKNSATGPVSAHIFSNPGTYTISLTVTDGTNSVKNQCTQITVQDPAVVFAGSNTLCVSSTGTFADAPAGFCSTPATQIVSTDFAAALLANAQPGKRLLFRGGETFTVGATPAVLNSNGPGIIGSYGTGKAKIQSAAVAAFSKILKVSSGSTPTIRDWRIMDIEFDGQSNPNLLGISADGGFDELTLLRIDIHDTAGGIGFDPDTLSGYNSALNTPHHISDSLTIADSSISRMIGGSGYNGSYIVASRHAFLGNIVDDTTGAEIGTRYPYLGKAVISNNTYQNPAATKHTLAVRAPNSAVGTNHWPKLFTSPVFTEQVLISDNKFVAGALPAIVVQIQPTNTSEDGRIRNVVFERNWITSGVNTQFGLTIQASTSTLRNNIVDLTTAAFHTGFNVAGAGAAAASDEIALYHNTIFSNSTGDFFGIRLQNGTSNIVVNNNLGVAANATTTVNMINLGGTVSPLTQSANSSNTEVKTGVFAFVTSPPSVPAHFKPLSGYAIGAGVSVPVWSDFFLSPLSSPRDLGAVLH